MNDKLILRTVSSPFLTPYDDNTKGNVLSHTELDNNFIYLKGNVIYTAVSESGIVTLKKLNGNDITFSAGTNIGDEINGVIIINSGITATTINSDNIYGDSVSATTYLNLPPSYDAGPITSTNGWSSTGSGQINLPQLDVALYDNDSNLGLTSVYTVNSGTTGSGSIPALTDNDTNYIVIEYSGGTPVYNVYNNDGVVNDSSSVLVYTIYRLGNFIHVLEYGDFGAGLPNKINDRIVHTDRFGWESGLMIGLSGTTGVITLTAGVAWNSVYRQTLTAVNSQDDIFFKNYHSGGTWTYTTTGNTLNNTYYDDGTDIVSATTGNYLINYYYRGQELNDHLYEVYGNNEYTSLAEAEAADSPALPELITSHAFLVGRIVVKAGETTGSTQTAFGTVFTATGSAPTSGIHNDLNGLQGGVGGEYYHLTSTEYNNLNLAITGTPFYLYGTTTDSKSNKTGDIERSGRIFITQDTENQAILSKSYLNVVGNGPTFLGLTSASNVTGENPFLRMARFRDTYFSPSMLLANDILGSLEFQTGISVDTTATIRAYATENHVDGTSQGIGFKFYGVPTGTTTLTTVLDIKGNGDTTVYGNFTFNGQANNPLYNNGSGNTFTIDWNNSNIQTITLTGNTSIANPINVKEGASYQLIIKQGAGGPYTINSWGTNFKWEDGTYPALSTGTTNVDIITFITDDNGYLYGIGAYNFY